MASHWIRLLVIAKPNDRADLGRCGWRKAHGSCPRRRARRGGSRAADTSTLRTYSDAAPRFACQMHPAPGRHHRAEIAQCVSERVRVLLGRDGVEPSAHRLANREQHDQREENARHAYADERGLPAAEAERCGHALAIRVLPPRDDRAADRERRARSDIHAHRIKREDRAPACPFEIVAEQRYRRGRRARFAHADADAGHTELREVARQARHGGHERPERQAECERSHAAPAVGEARERDAEHAIEQRERRAVEEAQLRVADAHVLLQIGRKNGDDLAIHIAERVDEREDE